MTNLWDPLYESFLLFSSIKGHQLYWDWLHKLIDCRLSYFKGIISLLTLMTHCPLWLKECMLSPYLFW